MDDTSGLSCNFLMDNEFEFEGLNVLDLFSGTGSISYEFELVVQDVEQCLFGYVRSRSCLEFWGWKYDFSF